MRRVASQAQAAPSLVGDRTGDPGRVADVTPPRSVAYSARSLPSLPRCPMPDPTAPALSPRDAIRPLLRTRQVREFTDEALTDAELEAIADAGRWSGSSENEQPWRFIVIRDVRPCAPSMTSGCRRPARSGRRPRPWRSSCPRSASDSYPTRTTRVGRPSGCCRREHARARRRDRLDPLRRARTARRLLGLPDDRIVRTVLSLGHPTEAALRPKSKPEEARRPRQEAVFEERWPTE